MMMTYMQEDFITKNTQANIKITQKMMIIIVRHPFERIISAYKDKFTKKDAPKSFSDMKMKYCRLIVRKNEK